jgi:hypothetical protein
MRFWLRWYVLGILVTATAAALLMFLAHGPGPANWVVSAFLPGLWLLAAIEWLFPAAAWVSGPVSLALILLVQIVVWHLIGVWVLRGRS